MFRRFRWMMDRIMLVVVAAILVLLMILAIPLLPSFF